MPVNRGSALSLPGWRGAGSKHTASGPEVLQQCGNLWISYVHRCRAELELQFGV